MKILQIVPSLQQGGVEIGTLQLAKTLARKKNYQSFVMSNGGRLVKQLENDGSTHIAMNIGAKNPFIAIINIFRLAYIIRKYKIDIIHIRSRVPAIIAFFAQKMTRCQSLSTIHAFYKIHNPIKKYYNHFMMRADHLVAISYPIKEYIMDNYNIDDKNINVILRGCDDKKFQAQNFADSDHKKWCQQYDIAPNTIIFALIGRISSTKKQDVAINAFYEYLQKYPQENVTLLLCGEAKKNSPYPQKCHDLVKQYKLEKYVKFINHHDDIAFLLHHCDYLLSCRDDEAFGRSVIEAQAMGCYVICADKGTPYSLLVHKDMGCVFESNNPSSLAQQIHDAVNQQQHKQRQQRLEKRDLLFPLYSQQKMCDDYITLYEHLKPKKILVIRHGALGDIIFTLGAMAAIRNYHDKAHITLLTKAPFADMLEKTGLFDDVMIDPKPKLHQLSAAKKLRRDLRALNADVVYDLQVSRRSMKYFYLIFCPKPPRWVGRSLFASDYDNSPLWGKVHNIQRLEGLVKQSGINDIPSPSLTYLNAGQKPPILDNIDKYALLIIGASAHRSVKKWPIEQYALLANWLCDHHITPIIIGSKIEAQDASFITEFCPKAIDLTAQTQIHDIAEIAKSAYCIIGNDTGPLLICALSHQPTLALYGGETNLLHSLAYGECVDYIQKPYIHDITIDDVTHKLANLLKIA